jgi:hypothetical protein
MKPADNIVALSVAGARGGGQFFAVDKRAFAAACALGLNEAAAYLVIACGSGRNNATSSWSATAIEKYAGISRRGKAKEATQRLVEHELLGQEGSAMHPRYKIVPGHQVPPVLLSFEERWAYDKVARDSGKFSAGSSGLAVAGQLAARGLLKAVGRYEFALPDSSAEPQWIWLPNAIVVGAGEELPPLRLLREMQDVRRLQLFVAMYDSHDLAGDGGISRAVLWQQHTLTKVGQHGASSIWAFDPQGKTFTSISSSLFTTYVAPGLGEDAREAAANEFWGAIHALEGVKLFAFVTHIFESDQPEAELIHAYAVDAGESWEQQQAHEAHADAYNRLSQGQQEWANQHGRRLISIPSHIDKLAVIGIARLRYKPHTRATAAWIAKGKPATQPSADGKEQAPAEVAKNS